MKFSWKILHWDPQRRQKARGGIRQVNWEVTGANAWQWGRNVQQATTKCKAPKSNEMQSSDTDCGNMCSRCDSVWRSSSHVDLSLFCWFQISVAGTLQMCEMARHPQRAFGRRGGETMRGKLWLGLPSSRSQVDAWSHWFVHIGLSTTSTLNPNRV